MIWQSPYAPDRRKFHVGDLIRANNQVALFYNRNSLDWVQARNIGFEGYPAAFPANHIAHHQNVLEIISRRVPPRNRTDFSAFLYKNGLSNRPNISDLALIGYSGAKLPGDGFSFEIDFSIEEMPFDFTFEISGFRYYSGMHLPMEALINHQVVFTPEPHNPHDANAVSIVLGNVVIGYVPRSIAPWLSGWLQYSRLGAWISKIEGPPTRPLVYVFLTVAKPMLQQTIAQAFSR